MFGFLEYVCLRVFYWILYFGFCFSTYSEEEKQQSMEDIITIDFSAHSASLLNGKKARWNDQIRTSWICIKKKCAVIYFTLVDSVVFALFCHFYVMEHNILVSAFTCCSGPFFPMCLSVVNSDITNDFNKCRRE